MEFEWKYEKQIPLIRTGGAGTNKQTEEQPLLLGGNKVSSWALKMEFTPCTAVQAGQEIKGQLTIHCKKAVNATGLEMYFRGKDITSIHYKTTMKLSGNGHSTKDHNPRDKAEICHVDIGIPQILLDKMIQNGKLVPGTHKIPYNVHVPPNSPPSMCLKLDGQDEAAVEYAIRAKLKGSGKFQDYQDILPVRILAAPQRRQRPDQPTQYKIGPTALDIQSVFTASNKGSITFTLLMADTTVVAGTNANIHLSIDNLDDDKDAKKLLRHVEISMTQRIDLRAWSHTSNHVRQVASAQFPVSVFCKGGPQLLSLPIPQNDLMVESFETKHILLYRHELRVSFVTPMTTANPSVEIPILFVKEFAPALPVAVATPVPTATIPAHAITATVHKATQDTKVGINLQGQNGKVVVTKISDTSPFRETDLEKGMIIYQINNVVIDSQLATDIHGVLGIIVAAKGDVTILAAFEEHNNDSDLEC